MVSDRDYIPKDVERPTLRMESRRPSVGGLSWQIVVVLVAVIACSSVLAVMHVVSPDWVERTLTGVLGLAIGTTLGYMRARRES